MEVYNNDNNTSEKYSEKKNQSFFPRSELNDWTPIWEKIVFFLIGFIGPSIFSYIISYIFIAIPSLIEVNEDGTMSFTVLGSTLANFLVYLLLIVIFLLFLFLDKRKTYKRVFSGFIDIRTYIWGLIGFGLVIASQSFFSYLYTLTIPFYGSNANQSAIETYTHSQPVLMIITTVIFAPFAEELTYRAGLLDLSGHKYSKRYLGIIISCIVFGFIHADLISSYSAILTATSYGYSESVIQAYREAFYNELLNLPIYIISGACLGFTYAKSGKISASMTSHLLVNLFSMISIFASSSSSTSTWILHL